MSKVVTLDYEFVHDYTLIAINSTLEDYKLAYFLNKELDIKLNCNPEGLEFNTKNCSFVIFNYDCLINYYSWSLIANKHMFTSENADEISLFKEDTKTNYLINEKREIDFFLKITGDCNTNSIQTIIEKIKNIKGVITSYSIDPLTLKSKDYLIF